MNYSQFIKGYKNNIASQYVFYELDKIDQVLDQEYYCSKKIDGQTFFLVMENNNIKIFSSSLIDYSEQLTHIIQAVQSKKINENIIFVGELYDSKKERERNGDVKVGLANKKLAASLSLALFDIVYEETPSAPFQKKFEKLSKAFGNNQSDVIYALEQ